MEFDWSERDASHRQNVRSFLDEALPADWEEISQGGPGSDAQAEYSKQFCRQLADRGWLTPHWPRDFGGGGPKKKKFPQKVSPKSFRQKTF